MEAREMAKDAIIRFEEGIDDLSKKYREKFGYGDSIRVVPYLSYGHGKEVKVRGRVLSDKKVEDEASDHPARNLWGMLKRYRTDEVASARLKITIGDFEAEVVTDGEGYFDEMLELDEALRPEGLFAEYDIELLEPHSRNEQYETHFKGRIEMPANARFGLISDIDDTVVYTGANNFLRHTLTVILNNAHTRTPFLGVAPFYEALQAEQGVPTNPIFYVSSSPTNLYELFVDFMNASDIPVGPIMLKDFGFDTDKFLKSGHSDYKRARIESVMDAFPRLSFILVGDSGQEDPEIYRELVEKRGDRILAIYIRDVSEDERSTDVEKIAAEVREKDIPMLLMRDSLEAAKHAAEHRWITPDELERVREHVENPEEHRRESGLLGSKVDFN